ncbi:MAG: PAS domain-containing protein [Methyloversatilis sp.]|jgi:two-component system sensor histidine kinase HupT/HoxJ|nr:PAS domain-containing protein [Methyloversatilis sp.]MBP6193423.1 PAS domain-containing protein [Methyloversatilis sp.]
MTNEPKPAHTEALLARAHIEGVDEATWIDVIQRMDEVYSQLVSDEIALEQKNVELEQSQQFIFSVMSAMSDVLLVCNERGEVEETNAALCELVGRSDDELRGMTLYDLLADEASVERVRGVLDNTNPSRRGEAVELNLLDAQRSPLPVDANCTPRFTRNGRRAGTVFVGRPTAELKRAYDELRDAHEALKRAQQQLLHSEKMASLGRLVAGVAHELNNPISFVLGNVHALKRYSERMGRYIDAVHAGASDEALGELRTRLRIEHLLRDLPSLIEGTLEGAQRTADIVNGLKRFSAVDPEGRASVDLNEVTERAIHWIRKGTTASVDMHWQPGPTCVVMGSAGQLQQVVMNLLQNACDAAAGETGDAAARLQISTAVDGDNVRMILRDNGPGIPDEYMSRIFEPFFTTKPIGKGTGLGLSISYGIVEQHGGRLTARNHPGGGAEFTLELPRSTAPPRS